MADLGELGGASGAGALFGAFLVWSGFKSRLDSQDKQIEQLTKDQKELTQGMVSPQKCDERGKNCCNHFGGIEELLGEMREDIKKILSK